MAGYRRPVKTYKLVFADKDMEGLEVRAKSVPLGKFLELTQLANIKDTRKLSSDDLSKVGKLFEIFAAVMVSWNLEDEDGNPVPATVDGLYSQDIGFVLSLILAWMDAIAGVSGPLDRTSSGGVPFPEESIPMTVAA